MAALAFLNTFRPKLDPSTLLVVPTTQMHSPSPVLSFSLYSSPAPFSLLPAPPSPASASVPFSLAASNSSPSPYLPSFTTVAPSRSTPSTEADPHRLCLHLFLLPPLSNSSLSRRSVSTFTPLTTQEGFVEVWLQEKDRRQVDTKRNIRFAR
uniref:Uncharacterized protein n=1 Tax=Odontella aurita TaxID=265563 RepID=A0A7S4K567_9STRA